MIPQLLGAMRTLLVTQGVTGCLSGQPRRNYLYRTLFFRNDGETDGPTSSITRKRTIDYFLVEGHWVHTVSDSGVLPKLNMNSDHRAVFIKATLGKRAIQRWRRNNFKKKQKTVG